MSEKKEISQFYKKNKCESNISFICKDQYYYCDNNGEFYKQNSENEWIPLIEKEEKKTENKKESKIKKKFFDKFLIESDRIQNNVDVYNNEVIITLKNINISYKKNTDFSIKRASFIINKGEFHVFIGENGAGKSTIINAVIGNNPNYEGTIQINGINVREEPTVKNKLSYIPDHTTFPTNINCRDFLLMFSKLAKRDRLETISEINELAENFGILNILKKNPNKLSTGQKKKILIIKSVIEKAEIIILDEPAANLDPTARFQLFEILKQLQTKGTTIFMSTHLINEVMEYVDSATFISKGEVLWTGKCTPSSFHEIYQEIFIKRGENV